MKNSGIWKKQNCLYKFIFLNMMVNNNNTKSLKNIDYITIADQSRTVRPIYNILPTGLVKTV